MSKVIKKISGCLFLIFISCSTPPKITYLVSESFLKNSDSIKIQAPNVQFKKNLNKWYYSNIPVNLDKRKNDENTEFNAWEKIKKDYKSECYISIDTINKTEVIIKRSFLKWTSANSEILNVKKFKKLLLDEGIQENEYEIKQERISELGGMKNLVLELWYKGTINYISIRNLDINITTFLESQISYWEKQGYQFSTTTEETIKKYKHKLEQ